MRPGLTTLLLVGAALSVAACQKKAADQTVARDNNLAANADIEALPPDESSETPSNELVNGTDNPEVNDLNSSNSSY
jgi:hypothetical protein